MSLLSLLGLPVLASGAAAPLPLVPAPPTTAASATGGAGARAPVRSTVAPPTPPAAGQDALGPAADGPDLVQLYVLNGRDGRELDASNSQMGARLNEVGKGLAHEFGRFANGYTGWIDAFTLVAEKSNASESELEKLKAAKAKFVGRASRDDAMSEKAEAVVNGIRAVQTEVARIKPLVTDADAKMIGVLKALKSKDVRSDGRDHDAAKERLAERQEEIKAQQELFSGTLDLLTKVASITEWVEIVPDVLSFANKQMFDNLPRADLESLKRKVDEAKAKLQASEDVHDALAIQQAHKELQAATERLDNGHDAVKAAIDRLAIDQQQAIVRLARSRETVDAANMIAASRKMAELMAKAVAVGLRCIQDIVPLSARCKQVAEQYAGFVSLVRSDKKLTSGEVDAMSEPARLNAETLKSWAAYLDSVHAEVKDGVAACRDTSDKGYMKNYNQIGPLLQEMLSGA